MIEVLFAVFAAGICALIFSAAMPAANKSRAMADKTNVAVGLAQKLLESMKTVDPSLNPSTLYSAGLIDSPLPIGTNKYSFTNADAASRDNPATVLPTGTGAVTIELIDIELRRVTVDVAWKENGRDRAIKIGTLVANMDN